MKIKINEDEFYEIILPDEIACNQFLEIYEKFGNIFKLIKLSKQDTNLIEFKEQFNKKVRKPYTLNPNKIFKRTNTNPFLDTREKVVDLMQYAYHGNKLDRERISKLMGYSWGDINKRFHNLFIRFDIKANEIGLMQIPTKTNRGIDLRIPNYIIKSHTGVFDEK